MKQNLEALVDFPEIVLVYLGTRPDYFSPEHLKVIKGFSAKLEVGLEFGLQSARDKTLDLINRGHNFKQFETAVGLTKSSGIFTTAHIIIGLPGETFEDNLYTINQLNRLGIDSIKIHQLYIVKDTELHHWYLDRIFKPLSFDEAIENTARCLASLNPKIIIQRLTGDPKPGQLIAPDWIRNKHRFLNRLEKFMEREGLFQGKFISRT